MSDGENFEKRKKVIDDLIHDKHYVPMKRREIAILLNIPKERKNELCEVLDELVSEGRIGLSRKGKYCRAENTAVTGIFEATRKGFGFVVVENEEDDIFISEKDVNGAFHHDKVMVAIISEKNGSRRREGKIIRVIEHGTDEIVGIFEKNGAYGFVIPDNPKFSRDIFIPKDKINGAMNGHKVVVHIDAYGDEKNNPEGTVIRIIGHVNDPGTDILSVAEAYEIPCEYPEEVMETLNKIPDTVNACLYSGRTDCREWLTVTIDGEDAKDLDDAVTITREGDIYRLGVHIADVSEYVKENTPIDTEALKRGTSVYLVDRVIPMLPHKLSNGICSLNQGEDRLALSCIMDIDSEGNVVSHRICETLINVDRRMSYNEVQAILDDIECETALRLKEYIPMVELMNELAVILRRKRHKRGSIDFDFPECKIILDKKGKPVDVREYERNAATRIIEDFMLIANETVAEDGFWQEIPFIYRTHDNPEPEKIRALGMFINNFGHSIRISNNEIHPKELQKLIEETEGTDEEALISRLTLRSMKRAVYTTECKGHFGLAARYYTHFTSPIRRYPDLQIHRIIKENLRNGINEERRRHYEVILPEVSKNCSITERRADDAEREVEKMKKTEYMTDKIGECFEGVISGITAWGIYVELPNTIEGMIHVKDMEGDCYIFDEANYEMRDERTGIAYSLGEKVRVICTGADKLQRTVDFKFYRESR